MRAAIVVAVVSAFHVVAATGRSDENLPPPFGAPVRVPVNSQKSLADVVGDGFPDESWESPNGLLPRDLPGLTYVSGPGDPGLFPKGAWRKPVTFQDRASGAELSVNCYRLRHDRGRAGSPGTPFSPLLEPDYRYMPSEFHGLRAAAASQGNREVFIFRDGELLFKIEATGEKAEVRRRVAAAVAEAIWTFRHPE